MMRLLFIVITIFIILSQQSKTVISRSRILSQRPDMVLTSKKYVNAKGNLKGENNKQNNTLKEIYAQN